MQRRTREPSKGHYPATLNMIGWKVTITPESVEVLTSKIQHNENEDCGLLFASQVSKDSIRINSISESCSIQDEAQRCSCILDIEKANTAISEEFEKSNHTRFYIGEWHTHPEDFPTPSLRDYKSLKESYHKNIVVVPNIILMAIVGRKAICWKMFDGNAIRDIVI